MFADKLNLVSQTPDKKARKQLSVNELLSVSCLSEFDKKLQNIESFHTQVAEMSFSAPEPPAASAHQPNVGFGAQRSAQLSPRERELKWLEVELLLQSRRIQHPSELM